MKPVFKERDFFETTLHQAAEHQVQVYMDITTKVQISPNISNGCPLKKKPIFLEVRHILIISSALSRSNRQQILNAIAVTFIRDWSGFEK